MFYAWREYLESFSVAKNFGFLFVAALVCAMLIGRVLPPEIIGLAFFLSLFLFLEHRFYNFLRQNQAHGQPSFFWAQPHPMFNHTNHNSPTHLTLWKKYLDYKNYLSFFATHKKMFFWLGFVFADIFLAATKLSPRHLGVYICFSFLTKFVFVLYIYAKKDLPDSKADNVVGAPTPLLNQIFFKHLNHMVSLFLILFLVFFAINKSLVWLFLGETFLPYHTSLVFIFLGNAALVGAMWVASVAYLKDPEQTKNLAKYFSVALVVLWLALPLSQIDNIAFFVSGLSLSFAWFLYQLCLKIPTNWA